METGPRGILAKAAQGIDWISHQTGARRTKCPFYEWFADSEVNACYNAVDRHVEQGRSEQTAIIYDSPVTDTKEKITFASLQEQTALMAGVLKAQGIEKGDRVIIYMPMIPKPLSLCWLVLVLVQFTQLFSVDLPQMNLLCALMMLTQSYCRGLLRDRARAACRLQTTH